MRKILVVHQENGFRSGPEAPTHEVIDWDGTLRDYVIEDLQMSEDDGYDMEKELDGSEHNKNGFGILPDGSEENGYHYEGEEINITYSFLKM